MLIKYGAIIQNIGAIFIIESGASWTVIVYKLFI